jgi:hypothetical protein
MENLKNNEEQKADRMKENMTEERLEELSKKFDLPQEIILPEDNKLPDPVQNFYFSQEDFDKNSPEKGETYQIGEGPIMGYNPDLPPPPPDLNIVI